MNTLPFLPTEIIDKINTMATEMHKRDMQELNRAVRFNSCMKFIEYTNEDFLDDWGNDENNNPDVSFYRYMIETLNIINEE